MNGTNGVPDGGGVPGGYAGLPGANAALLSSSSNVNSSSVVSGANGSSAFAPQTRMVGSDGTDPPAKRIKLESGAQSADTSPTVANMAAVAVNRATLGSGISTGQFLQSLPQGYTMNATPAYMVMLQQQQQQQQQHQQQQQQIQQQAHQYQLQQHQQHQQQLQIQRHMQLQRQAQQQQLQGPEMQLPIINLQPNMQSTTTSAQMQASAIMMAALNQNRLANLGQQQQQQPMQQVYVKTEATPASPVVPARRPQPSDDPCCLICQEKGEDLFLCSYSCGLTVHPRCVGEDKIFTTAMGAKACGSCFLTHQDRSTKENLHSGGATSISVRRAVLSLNADTSDQVNFDKFGHLTSLRLYEIAQIAGYPLAPFAMRSAEQHMQRWVREKLSHFGTNASLNVRDIFTMVIGLYSLDRVNVAHSWRNKVIEAVKAKNYQATDYMGWHPVIEGPNVRCSSLCTGCTLRNQPEALMCTQCRRALVFPSIFTKFNSALLASFYADRAGVSFGVTFLDTFSHTHSLRSHYKGLKPIDPNGHDWAMFVDQLRSVFGLIDIVSDFGVLELDPALFEPEVKIIFNPQYLNQAIMATDYELVGRFLQCMKQFGKPLAEQYKDTIGICERSLLVHQLPDGGWCKPNGNIIDRYKATAACAKGLLNPLFRGRGPINMDVQRLLVKWAKKTPGSAHAKRAEQLGTGKLLVAGVTLNGKSAPNLKRLEVFYRRQIVPASSQNPLEVLATARLKAIWKPQTSKPEDESVKDELTSAATDNEDTESADASVKAEKPASADGGDEDQADASAAQNDEDDSLINLSLSGELSLFDGLKFEDGDVIDIGTNGSGDAGDGDGDKGDATDGADDDEQQGDEDEQVDNAPSDEQDDRDDAATNEEDDMYDDDDDGDDGSQLPEPELTSGVDATVTNEGELDSGTGDLGELDVGIALDDEFGQASMDLGMDL